MGTLNNILQGNGQAPAPAGMSPIGIQARVHNGRVNIIFNQPVRDLSFSPEGAIKFADAIMKLAWTFTEESKGGVDGGEEAKADESA